MSTSGLAGREKMESSRDQISAFPTLVREASRRLNMGLCLAYVLTWVCTDGLGVP